jgi:tape measure domain-containing protein
VANYKAGTAYVEIVPLMKGFFKEIANSMGVPLVEEGKKAGSALGQAIEDEGSKGAKQLKDAFLDCTREASDGIRRGLGGALREVANDPAATRAAGKTGDALEEMGEDAEEAGRKVRKAGRETSAAGRDMDEGASAARRAGEGFLSLKNMALRAVGPMAAMAAAVGIGGFVGEAIEASDAANKFASTLTFAGYGAEQIERLGAAAQEYADKTVYNLSDIQGITSQLAANNVKDFDQLAEAAGNLNAVAGGTKDTYKSLGLALVQVNGAGRLQTQDWNQVAAAIPGASGRIQQALSDMGAYTGEFRQAMSEGQISAEEFNQALLSLGFDDAAKEAAASTATIEGAAGNLQATIMGGFKDMIDYVKPALTDFMGWLSDTLAGGFAWVKDTLVPSLQGVWDIFTKGDFTGPIFGFEEDSSLVDFLFGLRDAASAVWDAFKAGWDAASALAGQLAPLAQDVWGLVSAFGGEGPGVIQSVADALKTVFDWVGRNTGLIATLTATVAGGVAGFKLYAGAADLIGKVKAAGSIMEMMKATKLATTVQAAFNAVMNMNPIGLLVTAIAALVAGLVYFFTQTETGKRAWAALTEAFSSFIGWVGDVWSSTLGAVSEWWTSTWSSVSGFFDSYVVQPMQTAWGVITGIWDGIVNVFKTAFAFITGVVLLPFYLYFQAWAAVFSWAWETLIKPAWDAFSQFLVDTYTNVIQPVFEWIMGVWNQVSAVAQAVFGALVGFFQGIWDSITGAISAAWTFIVGIVTSYVTAVWAVVSTVFNTVWAVVSTVWNAIASTISGVWTGIKDTASAAVNWVRDTVTGIFDNMSSAVSSTFEGMKNAIENIWNQVKGVCAKPINFVIDTVYTNGLKYLVETVASKIGLSLTLPTVPRIAEYAGGGIIPGYRPGHDTIPAMLSPGEAVLVPELVRQIGPSRIIAANYAASHRRPGGSPGKAPTGFSGGGVAHFAGGGIAGWFSDMAKGVADFFADPVESVLTLITTPVRALLGGIAPGVIGELASGGIESLLSGVTSFFKKKTEESSSTGLVGAAMRAVQMQVPYVWGGSSIPPGLDCSGLVYWAAQQLGLGWPRLTAAGYQSASTPVTWANAAPGDLLFWGNPAHHVAIFAGGNKMVEEPKPGLNARNTTIWGSPTVGRYGAARKYDAGGWLPPGVTAAVNQTGAREAVLTARQWADIHALATTSPAPSLDGQAVNLVLDDGRAFSAHLEAAAVSVLARRKTLAGRSR